MPTSAKTQDAVRQLRRAFAAGAEWANGKPFPNPRGVEMEAEDRYPIRLFAEVPAVSAGAERKEGQ